jgi:hypothetical protein
MNAERYNSQTPRWSAAACDASPAGATFIHRHKSQGQMATPLLVVTLGIVAFLRPVLGAFTHTTRARVSGWSRPIFNLIEFQCARGLLLPLSSSFLLMKTRSSYSLCRPSRSHGTIEGKWKCRGKLAFVCLPLTFREMWKGRKYFFDDTKSFV